MSPAADTEALRSYHESTKHSYWSVRRGGFRLDWANEPSRFKTYRGIDGERLPPFTATGLPWHRALAGSADHRGGAPVGLEALSSLLFHAAGVHRTYRGRYGEFRFRTYACAGALYPNEVYVVAGDLPDLPAGVYHYHPLEHALRRLREGDFRGTVAAAGGGSLGSASAVLAFTGIPWRSSWKYGPRAYRHLFWDSGMMLANLLAVAAARAVAVRVVLGFIDADVNALLGVEGDREFALVVAALGRGRPAPPPPRVEPAAFEVAPLSARERREPAIEAAHRASSLGTNREVRAWSRGLVPAPTPSPGEPVEVAPLSPEHLSSDGIEDVIRRRGSSRRLDRRGSVPAPELAALLDIALGDVPLDARVPPPTVLLVAHSVEGLTPGTYAYEGQGRFCRLREGAFRRRAGYLCLEQDLGADAGAVVFLMADVDGHLGALGNRGYRAAQLRAAVAAGRIYLAAYGQCLGASGITFYDDEVSRFFDRPDLSPMLAVVVGPEGARRSIIRCRVGRAPSR